MNASTETTGTAQHARHSFSLNSITTTGRRWAASPKKIVAVAALGLAGFLSVTACTNTPLAAPAPAPSQSQSASPSQPSTAADPSTPTDPSQSPDELAAEIANVAVGNGVLTPLADDDVTAVDATCDPQTVSDPVDVNTPTTASCDITYSDGSVWEQTVTITFDNQGSPAADSTNVGVELSQPTGE